MVAAGLLLASASVGVVTQSATAQSADEKVTFTVGLRNEADSLNPFTGYESLSYELWALNYDFLVGYSMEDMSPEPGLATEWTTSDDGLTWTFKVRDGVTFSDGVPLTAKDVAYTYNRVLDGGAEKQQWGSYLTSVTSVTAPDDTTVVLTLKKPNATLPLLPIPIVPEHIWSDVSEKEVKRFPNEPSDGSPLVGSGPFQLVEGAAGAPLYRLEANPNYWGGAPHVDEVVFKVYKAEDPEIQALIKGEIDFAEDISPIQVKSLQGKDGITAINGDSPGFDEIAFNTGAVDLETNEPIPGINPAVKDPAFRHALGYALDLEGLNERVYQGAGKPGDSIVPPAYGGFRWEPSAEEAFTYDPDRAAQMLDDAGYTVGSDGFRTLPNGDPIGKLRMFARSDGVFSAKVMEYFQEWLKAVNIDSDLQVVEEGRLGELILDGDFDVFEWGWFVEPDPDSMLSYFTCDQRGGWSDSWYCDETYEAMYNEQHAEVDDAARVEIIKNMQAQLFKDSPYLVTSYNTSGEAIRSDRFACLRAQPEPDGVLLFQYGTYNYTHMRPVAEAGDCEGEAGVTEASKTAGEDSGVSTGVLVGIGIGVLVLAGVGGVVMTRRRSTVEDRE